MNTKYIYNTKHYRRRQKKIKFSTQYPQIFVAMWSGLNIIRDNNTNNINNDNSNDNNKNNNNDDDNDNNNNNNNNNNSFSQKLHMTFTWLAQ